MLGLSQICLPVCQRQTEPFFYLSSKAATDAGIADIARGVTYDSLTGVGTPCPLVGEAVNLSYDWRVELFAAFKDVLETKKIYSRYFKVNDHVKLRLGVYESWETLCVYLESDEGTKRAKEPEKETEKEETDDPDQNRTGDAGGSQKKARPNHPHVVPVLGKDGNHWVRYRIGLVNQKNNSKTVWKESAVCTKTWTSQVRFFFVFFFVFEPVARLFARAIVDHHSPGPSQPRTGDTRPRRYKPRIIHSFPTLRLTVCPVAHTHNTLQIPHTFPT